MQAIHASMLRSGRLAGVLVFLGVTLTGLLAPATALAVDIANPDWNVGDYWIVKDVQINRFSVGHEPLPALQWLYCVVARTNLGGVACLIVEKWPNPAPEAFPLQHTVYYFRASDLRVVRRMDWFYLHGHLCGPAKLDYGSTAGLPHVEADGIWLPAFGATPQADGRALHDERGQILSQLGTALKWTGPTNAAFAGPRADDALLLASSGRMCVQVDLSEGVGDGNTSQHLQVWRPGLPWYLYEQQLAGAEVVGESRLVETGLAVPGEDVRPFDPVDVSPLAETGRTVPHTQAEALPNVDLVESYTAAFEPWAGCWWPFLDLSANANLYDTNSVGNNRWHAMKTYDDYFTPGKSTARTWEYAHHRTTDPTQWWWGHCDGWACASIMEPSKPLTTCGPFQAGEQEGLFAECWNVFNHALLYPSGGNVNDNVPMTPGQFWKMLRDNIRGDNTGGIHRPIGFDLFSCPSSPRDTDQVWNYPVFAYTVTYAATGSNTYAGTIVVSYENDSATPTLTPHDSQMITYGFSKVVINGDVVNPNSGTWLSSTWNYDVNGDGRAEPVYPDVAWYPLSPVGENPYINYLNVRGMNRVAAPGLLSATSATNGVLLTWLDNASNETGFKIEAKSDSSGVWTQIGTAVSNATSYVAAASSSMHVYRVRAYNSSDGNSLYSNEAAVGSGVVLVPVPLVINGPAVTGNLVSPGDVNWYTITITTDATYTIDTAPGTLADNYMYLYGPNSQTACLQEDDDSGLADAAQIVRPLTPGLYYVKIRAFDGTITGTYTICASTPSTAPVPLIEGAAPITGNIAPAADVDWYTFTVVTAGVYTINTSAGTLADNYMSLYGPDSQTALLQEDDDNGDNPAALIMRPLTAGTYYVKVRAYSTTDTGTYTINLSLAPPPIIVELTVNAAPITGTIAPAGDVDWYSFTVSTAGVYTINTASGTLADNYMYLYGPDSQTTLLQEDDDNGASLAAQIVRTLTVGTYYVKMRAYSATATGTYTIHVSLAPPATIVELSINAAPVTGTIAPAADVDWYSFTVATAGVYTINTAAGTLADNYMYLYGPNSQTTLLQEDDDNGAGLAAQIVRTLAVGTYYIKVRAYSATATGTYTINVTLEPPPTMVALTINAAPITGNIAPAGDADWYSFIVSAPGSCTIHTAAGTLADNYMYLYGPNSQTALLQQNDDNGSNLAAQIVRTLSVGTYYVKMRAYSATATGTYTINVKQ